MNEPTKDRASRVMELEKQVAELEAARGRHATQLRISSRRATDSERELRRAEEQLLVLRTNLREVGALIYDSIWSTQEDIPYVTTPLRQALNIIEREDIARDHANSDLKEQLEATGDEAVQLHNKVEELLAKIKSMNADASEQAAVIEELDQNLRNTQKANADLREQLDASSGVVAQLQRALRRGKGHDRLYELGDVCKVRRRIPVFRIDDVVTIEEIEVTDAGLIFYHVSGFSTRTHQRETGRVGQDEVEASTDIKLLASAEEGAENDSTKSAVESSI